jgi:hypothetical protein
MPIGDDMFGDGMFGDIGTEEESESVPRYIFRVGQRHGPFLVEERPAYEVSL